LLKTTVTCPAKAFGNERCNIFNGTSGGIGRQLAGWTWPASCLSLGQDACEEHLMRFHKSEAAFMVFILLVIGAGATLAYGMNVLEAMGPMHVADSSVDPLAVMGRYIFMSGSLLATACVFGICFIYPQIRTQLREEGKLRAMTESLSARSETLEHAALTDGLTGMQNRRYFDDALREYLEEFGRIKRPVGLLVLDLDHFKQVNDTHGHDVGDEVLRSVSTCLRVGLEKASTISIPCETPGEQADVGDGYPGFC
jgi:predicted signal transduction protein with EAL and GGDEF domain